MKLINFILRKIYLLLMLIVLSCNIPSTTKEMECSEIKRITSPDSLVDAVLLETNAGATTSLGYNLYIVPRGKKSQIGYEQFIADHIIDLEINWKEIQFLEIKYKQARIFKFTNFWHSEKVRNWSYVVELRLVPLIDTFSLSERDRWQLK